MSNRRVKFLPAVLLAALGAVLATVPAFALPTETLASSIPTDASPKAAGLNLISLAPSIAFSPELPLAKQASQATSATLQSGEALASKNASTGLSIGLPATFNISGGNLRITAANISNTRASGTSGNLRLALWATSTVPTFGSTVNFYSLGSVSLNPLAAGTQYTNIDQTVTFTSPPPGCYYLTLALLEIQSSSFVYVDLQTFTNGGTPDGAGYSRFAFGGATCSAPSSCTQDATTACLLNARFKATVRFRNAFDNQPADSTAFLKPVTGFASSNFETVFFYFNSANNIEILLKMLDQGNTNSLGQPTIAVLFGSATPLRVELTITDTATGTVRTYTSAFNTGQGGTDFTAFVK